MKKALIVGIDYYQLINSLFGCVNDSYQVKSVLERHSDGTKNFDVNHFISTAPHNLIKRKDLKNLVEELFKDKSDVALFYFSGHGYIESTGGYLITSECEEGDAGLPMNELLHIVNQSPATNKIIILDCCHSGIMGSLSPTEDKSLLNEGVTILTASSATQYALEVDGSGVFTNLLIDALNGGASNLVGDVTPGSIYSHIDQSLGNWQQRPIFKTNVNTFIPLRKVQPPIALSDLKQLINLFPSKGDYFKLDPTFEPLSDYPIEENVQKFKLLQKYNRVNLVVPNDAEHMYFAAMESKSCRLTILGEHYWNLITNDRI